MFLGEAMSIRGGDIRCCVLRTGVFRLLVAAFLLRALIPIGYMPDFSALSKGVLKVVVCSAYGTKTVMLDADGKPLHDSGSQKHEAPCAFSGIASIALPVVEYPGLPAPEFAEPGRMPRLAVVLPPARAGPPLGSRGPPQLS